MELFHKINDSRYYKVEWLRITRYHRQAKGLVKTSLVKEKCWPGGRWLGENKSFSHGITEYLVKVKKSNRSLQHYNIPIPKNIKMLRGTAERVQAKRGVSRYLSWWKSKKNRTETSEDKEERRQMAKQRKNKRIPSLDGATEGPFLEGTECLNTRTTITRN